MREGEDGRMLSGNGGYLNRFFTWWFGELRACMPNAISGVLFGAAEWLDVTLEEGEARFTLRRNGSVRDLGHVDLDPAAEESPQNAARDLLLRDHASIGHIALRLPADRVLMPKVELPIAAAENLREALAFEMDRHTPFSAEDVLFDFRVIGSDAELERMQIELLVVRKHDIDEALALAASMGLSPDCVAGPPADGPEAETFNLLSEAERPRPSRLVPRLVATIAVLTLVLGGVAIGLEYDRKQKTLALYEAHVAELRATTGETGRLEEKAERLLAVSGYLVEKKQRQVQMVEILDELTRRLPDEHYLISYSFRDGAVQLAGYSDDPSSVLRLLEESELFSQVRFAAPVTMDPRIGKERFNVGATVAREDGAQ
jgi:general secretion pathway protein L